MAAGPYDGCADLQVIAANSIENLVRVFTHKFNATCGFSVRYPIAGCSARSVIVALILVMTLRAPLGDRLTKYS
jgi:hypothetical protein